MKYILNTPYRTTAEHLAFEEAYLTGLDQGVFSDPLLYFWEVNSADIVLGASNKVNEEVINKKDNIFRRCSGGGTIVQGPGCLNYAFIMPISYRKELENLSSTNCYFMKEITNAFNHYFKQENSTLKCSFKGHTDLCIGNFKFSGNAQRRLRKSLLFHGTILYNYDIDIISKKLKHPPKEPDYRKSRKHNDFLNNIPLKKLTIISLFSQYFNSSEMQFKSIKDILEIEFNTFLEKHHDTNWIYKR